MYYIIYKTTNLINGKYYIGKHQMENLDDGYLGSGRRFLKAVKKYGKNNFSRKVLFYFDSWQEMNLKEIELITLDVVNDPMSYNVALGGEGGGMLGRKHTEETKAKLRQYAKEHPRKYTEEELKKMSEANKGKKLSKEQKIKRSIAARKFHSNNGSLKISEKYDSLKPKRSHIRKPICEVDRTQKRVYIHKNDKTMRIFKEELDYFFKDGWSLGRSKKDVEKYLKNRAVFKWMCNEQLNECKCVEQKDFEVYLNAGWRFGKLRSIVQKSSSKNIGKIWINNPTLKQNKMILKTEQIPDGWNKGRILF